MPDCTLFYAPVTVTPGDLFEITGSEYNHLVKALRYADGDQVDVADGQGNVIVSTIVSVENGTATCQADQVVTSENEIPVYITLGVGLVQNQRYEWMVEKTTELGVHKIQPLFTDRVVRSGYRHDRLEKKAIAAMKQSERSVLPLISKPCSVPDFMDNLDSDHNFYAIQDMQYPGWMNFSGLPNFSSIAILIGPEGGWSDKELSLFRDNDIQPVHLGNRRLRTETAAVTALSQLTGLIETQQTKREEFA